MAPPGEIKGLGGCPKVLARLGMRPCAEIKMNCGLKTLGIVGAALVCSFSDTKFWKWGFIQAGLRDPRHQKR